MSDPRNTYQKRLLSEGYPGLATLAHNQFSQSVDKRMDHRPELQKMITYLGRLVDFNKNKNLLIIGCGPKPQSLHFLLEIGFNAFGVEPVASFVKSAGEYLGSPDRMMIGSSEKIPFPDESQHFILMESVLEHVYSPIQSLQEIYRVLQPGGFVYITTTNRLSMLLVPRKNEFEIRFFDWLPAIVRESYIFHHLHYEPRLARFTERPAVHFFCYSELCKLGRQAGFEKFYSPIDLLRSTDQGITKSWFRRILLRHVQLNPWLRSLVLTQIGGTIIMFKRSA